MGAAVRGAAAAADGMSRFWDSMLLMGPLQPIELQPYGISFIGFL